jgi:hypothetical protein
MATRKQTQASKEERSTGPEGAREQNSPSTMPKPPKRLSCGTRLGGRRPPKPRQPRRTNPANTPRGLGGPRERAREERSTPLTSSPNALRRTTAPRHVPRQPAGKAIAHPPPTAGLTPAKRRAGGFAVLLADVLDAPVLQTPAAGTASRDDHGQARAHRSPQKTASTANGAGPSSRTCRSGWALEGLTAADIPARHAALTHRTSAMRVADPGSARRVPRASTEASPGWPGQRRPRSPRSARPSQEGE